MNIISYDIELKRGKKVKEDILDLISSSITENYNLVISNRDTIESSWNDLQYQELTSINSSAFLLFSFTIENVQVFVFKKETKNISSKSELSVTVVAISQKEINLIIKSSYLKISSIFSKKINFFSKKLNVSVIEGTNVNLYPFYFEKNDVLSPSFYIKAEYDNDYIKLDTKDWIKLLIFIIITAIFTIIYFTTPSEIIDPTSKEKIANNATINVVIR